MLANSALLVSSVQQSDSVTHMQASVLSQILSSLRLLQNSEQSSPCRSLLVFYLKYSSMYILTWTAELSSFVTTFLPSEMWTNCYLVMAWINTATGTDHPLVQNGTKSAIASGGDRAEHLYLWHTWGQTEQWWGNCGGWSLMSHHSQQLCQATELSRKSSWRGVGTQ